MPELPEVEVVRQSLEPFVQGQVIREVQIYHSGIFHQLFTEEIFIETVLGHRIEALKRRGKYLLILLDSGKVLLVHLRMTGKLLFRENTIAREKHDHLILTLDDGEIVYNDVRRFGGFIIFESEQEAQAYLDERLGLEPFSEAFTGEFLYQNTRRKEKPIKALLLDQTVVTGLGNIYADEVLFKSGIRPKKASRRLSRKECTLLVENIKGILEQAIAAGGSSINDYLNALGEAGHYQERHMVYGHGGEPCQVCGTPLKKVTLGGRTTVYCPNCQKS